MLQQQHYILAWCNLFGEILLWKMMWLLLRSDSEDLHFSICSKISTKFSSSVRFISISVSSVTSEFRAFMTSRSLKLNFISISFIFQVRLFFIVKSLFCAIQRFSKTGEINLFLWKGFGVNNGSIWKSNYPFITLSNEKKERRISWLVNHSRQLILIGPVSERWQSRQSSVAPNYSNYLNIWIVRIE